MKDVHSNVTKVTTALKIDCEPTLADSEPPPNKQTNKKHILDYSLFRLHLMFSKENGK